MNDREVEAVARAIYLADGESKAQAKAAIAALDAARSPGGDEVEAVARALMKRWIGQANADRYVGGSHTSPMVEPEEYDIDDPPEGMWEQALGDAAVALNAVRFPQGEDHEIKLTPGEIAREAANAELESGYPRVDGDVVVIGPEAFMARDGSVLCYRGRNYVPQSPQAEDHEAEEVVVMPERVVHNEIAERERQAEDHEAGVTPEMVDAARAAYRDYEPLTLAKYSEAWQFARMRTALVAALSRCPSPERLMCSEHEDRPAISYTARCRECYREFMTPSPERCTCRVRVGAPGERGERLSDGCPVHGPSPERDTEKLVEALRKIQAVTGTSTEANKIAREALAELSAGDTNKEK